MKILIQAIVMVCLAAGVAGSQPQEKTYRITGTVVNSVTGAAVAKVRVVMKPAEVPGSETESTTTANGRFAFEKVPPGRWSLFAERKGFLRQGYGQRSVPGSPPSSIVTGPGGVSEDLVFRLDPPAVIHGKVIDDAGEPVRGATVQALLEIAGGRKRFMVRGAAQSDDLGEYRIYDLPAVACYLFVAPPPATAPKSDPPPPSLAPQYFVNATDPKAATLLQLKPGDEIRADFALRRARGVSVRVEGASGSEGFLLWAAGPQGTEVMVGVVSPQRTPSFHDVPPGRYRLTVVNPSTGSQMSKRFEVSTADVAMALPFSEPSSVTTRAQVEDGDAALLRKAMVILHAEGDAQPHIRQLQADGTAVLPAVPAGTYRFFLGGIEKDLYIKSITPRNARVVDGYVDIPETGSVELNIVTGADGGRVKGKVVSGGKPAASALVVLAPRADSTNSADYHSYQTETDGSFDYTAVKPGEYILFATTDWQIEYGNPAAIRKYLAAGRPMRIEPKSSHEVTLEPLRP